jgi:hypothetical protein
MGSNMHSEHDHICGRCGASVDNQDKFCGCGADLKTMAECVPVPRIWDMPEWMEPSIAG